MDRLEKYRQILKEELEYQVSIPFSNAPDTKCHLVISENKNEFIVLEMGWKDQRYRHGLVFHFEFRNEKLWIHRNNTGVDIGEKLARKGIPKSDIVLGFIPEFERTAEGYAAA